MLKQLIMLNCFHQLAIEELEQSNVTVKATPNTNITNSNQMMI